MKKPDVPYYLDYVSSALRAYLAKEMSPVTGVPGLSEVGTGGGLESKDSLLFLCKLYDQLKKPLNALLHQRKLDRDFIDQRTRACFELNRRLRYDIHDPLYQTVIGHEDGKGRIVVGPKNEFYAKRGYSGAKVAPIPEHLQGSHVTLFGPPDDAKLSINALNSFHRKVTGEPAIVNELLAWSDCTPKWGADDEDSKTPLRKDLIGAGVNLKGCIDKTLTYTDPKSKKEYKISDNRLTLPIKRFPGLALPCTFLFYHDEPLPLHLYDFVLHLYANWQKPEALSFYVPKLENEEEAAYIKLMIETAEMMIQSAHPEYQIGTVRLLVVLENPRAIFRTNEIMDALHPYFAGASLGWHDYLASTARLFKEDGNYRIPVKADPHIVIKCIKASHDLLNEVVGSRGGIKIGGMYGILSIQNGIESDSFQTTLKGFIKDAVTQLKRGLDGFWVAHPDFVRFGLAIVEAFKLMKAGDSSPLERIVMQLLVPEHHEEMLEFIHAPDFKGLDVTDPLYPRSLIVADIKESAFIANNDSEEVRYNVFQTLQYLTDWLSGNGCVALPAIVGNVPVRVMDDLATAERSRWEVWHELRYGRFRYEDFIKIVHEEMLFIRKDRSDSKKIVQVKWDERTHKWYPIAMKLTMLLMGRENPAEFATELLMPFTVESIRNAEDPWAKVNEIDPAKYSLPKYIERFNEFFEICGSTTFAKEMSKDLSVDLEKAEKLIKAFTLKNIWDAANFHGDIGEIKKTLDATASREQALVLKEEEPVKSKLRSLGAEYLRKFGFKYLISAQGRSADEILTDLQTRMNNSAEEELDNAKKALWEISLKRLKPYTDHSLQKRIAELTAKHKVRSAQVAIADGVAQGSVQTFAFGAKKNTWFELASLSKTIASAFALDYFQRKHIQIETSVNSLLEKTSSKFRLPPQVQLKHLMNHQSLNMHYVNGIPANQEMPNVSELINGNANFNYKPVRMLHEPETAFQYSGGGFIVLEHLIESMEGKRIQELTRPWLDHLGLKQLSFEQKTLPGVDYARGYLDNGQEVEGGRKMFPAFAAGAMGTAGDVLKFLQKLTASYHTSHSEIPLSHDTAVLMLFDKDRASQKFMGVNIGLGTFVAEAGPNRLAIHQGANDGFRALYVQCYKGPDWKKGFVIFCNADNSGVAFVAELAQLLLKELTIAGVDISRFDSQFNMDKIPQEEIVNLGYKKLVFDAFIPDLPEAIVDKGPLDPLAKFNLAVGARVLEASNQLFARGENLVSDRLPVFDYELYGRQGKIMDSWESVRHNFKPLADPRDTLDLELKKPSTIRYVALSTQFHLGNHAPCVSLEGQSETGGPWQTVLPKTGLEGHAEKRIVLPESKTVYRTIRVSMYPDGGFSRLGLYADLPEAEKKTFLPAEQAKSVAFSTAIPQPLKPLAPEFKATPEVIERNWDSVPPDSEIDVACSAYGGYIIKATNEHYSPATQAISPFPPLNMFDGLESARSRKKGHFEEVIIGFAKPQYIHRIEIEFTYFRNNNPYEIQLDGMTPDGEWISVTAKTFVKPYAGNQIAWSMPETPKLKELKITVFPDGGFNRVRAYTKK